LLLALLAPASWGQEDGDGSMGIPSGEVGEDGDVGIGIPSGEVDEEKDGPPILPETLHKLHKMIDTDGDGKMSLDEILDFERSTGRAISLRDVGSVIEMTDTSKDGKLSLEEYLRHLRGEEDNEDEEEKDRLEQQMEVETAKFIAADGDRDGFLEESELGYLLYPETHDEVLSIAAKDSMRQKDADDNGMLSFEEFYAHDVPEGEEGPPEHQVDEDQVQFSKLDRNGDGHIDLEEFKAWEAGSFHAQESMRTLVNISDRDGDGHVTAEELAGSREHLADSEAMHHLTAWIEHHEL